jgi:hypothetical protein
MTRFVWGGRVSGVAHLANWLIVRTDTVVLAYSRAISKYRHIRISPTTPCLSVHVDRNAQVVEEVWMRVDTATGYSRSVNCKDDDVCVILTKGECRDEVKVKGLCRSKVQKQ